MARTPATECESSDQAQSASWRGDHEVAVGRFGRVFPTPIVQSPVSMVRCRCRSCGWLNSFTASSSDVFEWVVWQSRIVVKKERAVPAQSRPHSTTFPIPSPFPSNLPYFLLNRYWPGAPSPLRNCPAFNRETSAKLCNHAQQPRQEEL